MHAMENDVKPAFGAAAEVLEGFISRGIINWGEPVQSKSRPTRGWRAIRRDNDL